MLSRFSAVVLGLSLMAGAAYYGVRWAVRQDIERRLYSEATRIESQIVSRLDATATSLYDTRALFKATGQMSPSLFGRFVERSQLTQRFPGLRGIGVAEAFAAGQKEAALRRIRQVHSDAELRLTARGPVFSALMMFEPSDIKSRAAIGLDMLAEPGRRRLIERAFHTGRPVLSGPMEMLSDTPSAPVIMAMYLPVSAAHDGPVRPGDQWLVSGFQVQDFFIGAFGAPSLGAEKVNWRLESLPLFESEQSALVYDRFNPHHSVMAADSPQVSIPLTLLGRPFVLQVRPMRPFITPFDRYAPIAAAAILCALTFIVFLILLSGRRQLAAETQSKENLLTTQSLISQQATHLELLNRFSRSVTEELNEESLLSHFLSTIHEAKIDFAYLYVSNSSANSHLRLHSWVGLDDEAGIPEQISHSFMKQIMSNRFMLTKEHQIMGPTLNRLLGPRSKAEDWIVAVIPTRQRTDQLLLVAGNLKAPFAKLQKDLLDNVISHVGLGIDKITLIESAQTSNRSKSAFLANMSHEIRTPLNALMGFSEMLAGRELSDSRRLNIANSIRKNSEYLTRLIDDVLDLSKIEAGKLKIHHRRVRLGNLVHEIKSVIDLRANEKDLRFEIYCNGPLPSHVFVDDVRLKQILLNIAGNAVKFTNNGSVTMSISCRKRNEHTGDLVFYVEDTGVGISEDSQAHLFRPFSQGDETTTRKFGGSGLGLALSSRLASELGGSLKLIRSIRDVGSVFEIVVPTGDLQGAEWTDRLPAPTVAPNVPRIGRKRLEGTKVLLVEDSVDNQEIFTFFLRNAGAETKVVDNGRDAVAEGLRGHYDLILMDIQIPGIDGKEAARRLRSHGCMTSIVALTAHAMREEKESCLQAGCDGQITKPVGERDFVDAVCGFLNSGFVSASRGLEMGPPAQ